MKQYLVCVLVLLVAIPLMSTAAATQSSRSNLTIEVTSTFPKEIGLRRLKDNIASLLTSCRADNTSGSWNTELLETFESNRRQRGDLILDHLVDDDFISERPSRRRRNVVIDRFSLGRSDLQTDAVPRGFHLEVTLDGHVLQAVISRNSSQYSVAIWEWNTMDPSKTCGFSSHR